MSNVSGIGDAYYWSVFKIAEAFGLHRDTVKKRLLAANTPVAATVRGKQTLLISVVCVMCGLTLLQVQYLENITLLLLCVLLAQ